MPCCPLQLGCAGTATYHHGVGTGRCKVSFQRAPPFWHLAVPQSYLATTKHKSHRQACCKPWVGKGPVMREVGAGGEKQSEL